MPRGRPAALRRDGGGGRESTVMTGGTPLERWLDVAIARAATPRRAAVLVATVSTSITVVAGILMTVVDHENFPSIGRGLWFSVQTVTTVGYGDYVPETVAGRLLASLVMLLGIGFVTVITASITGTFVQRSRREQTSSDAAAVEQQLRRMDDRLERIEAALPRATDLP